MFYADGTIDYKGIPKQMLQQHTTGMNLHILKIFEMMENYDEDIIPYLRKFQKRYLANQLPDHYYIPFGHTGAFKSENLKLLSYLAKIIIREVK